MKSKKSIQTPKAIKREDFDNELPERDFLSSIAAQSDIKDPKAAVKYALEIWREAGVLLKAETRAIANRHFEGIPFPKKYPASLEDFFRYVVRAKTPSESQERFKDFFRETTRYIMVSESPQEESTNRSSRPNEMMTESGEIDRDRYAEKALAAYSYSRFQNNSCWVPLARDYLNWWRRKKSTKAREAVAKKGSTKKPAN